MDDQMSHKQFLEWWQIMHKEKFEPYTNPLKNKPDKQFMNKSKQVNESNFSFFEIESI